MQKGHPRRPSGGCSTGNIPQSGLGAGSAVLHQGRGMEKGRCMATERGNPADSPRDVVQGMCRRMASEQDRLYYISGLRRETGKSASEHGRVGDGGRAPRDVVRRICRRVASEQDRLYYISGGKRGKAPRNTADWGTAAGLYGM